MLYVTDRLSSCHRKTKNYIHSYAHVSPKCGFSPIDPTFFPIFFLSPVTVPLGAKTSALHPISISYMSAPPPPRVVVALQILKKKSNTGIPKLFTFE